MAAERSEFCFFGQLWESRRHEIILEMDWSYEFEWDPRKARINYRKHRVSFDRASTVFLDPFALSLFDEEHSQDEERWITLGVDRSGTLLVVCHTFTEISQAIARIRIMSSRKATKKEKQEYNKSRA